MVQLSEKNIQELEENNKEAAGKSKSYLLKALLFEISVFEKTKSNGANDVSAIYDTYGKLVKTYAESKNDSEELLKAIVELPVHMPGKPSLATDKIVDILEMSFQYNNSEGVKTKYFKAYTETLDFILSNKDTSKEWRDDKNVFDKTISDIDSFKFYENHKYEQFAKSALEILDDKVGLTTQNFLQEIKKLRTPKTQENSEESKFPRMYVPPRRPGPSG